MTLFSWIKKQLKLITPSIQPTRNNRQRRHSNFYLRNRKIPDSKPLTKSKPTAKLLDDQSPARSSEQSRPKAAEVSKSTANTSSEFQITSQLIFTYLDENGQAIANPDILTGISGNQINFQVPSFHDYYLTAIDNFTQTFADSDQEVTFHFALKNGLPVMTYCLDTDTGMMLKSVRIALGQLGERYQIEAPTIKGYRVVSSTGATYGHYDHQVHGIIFYYRHQHWATVQPVAYFVKLTAAHNVYSNPNGQLLTTGLPATIIIKVFARIDLDDQSSWLNIGGFEWIKNTQLEPSDPPTHNLIGPITKTSRNPVRLAGTVNFVPGKSIAVFDEPYGQRVGALLHGSRVSVRSTIVDDQGLVWYEMANQTVIPKSYLKIDVIK